MLFKKFKIRDILNFSMSNICAGLENQQKNHMCFANMQELNRVVQTEDVYTHVSGFKRVSVT